MWVVYKSCITLRTLNYGICGIIVIMGTKGTIRVSNWVVYKSCITHNKEYTRIPIVYGPSANAKDLCRQQWYPVIS